MVAGVGALIVGLVAIGVKLALGLVTVSVVGGLLGSFFGGPFDRLPSDQKQQLQGRFDAAVGDTLKGLSDADATARVDALIAGGFPRLDDATLVDYTRLLGTSIERTDDATCAAFAKAKPGMVDAAMTEKLISALDTASLGRWFDINLQAIEAQTKGSPAARTVPTDASDAMLTTLTGKLSGLDLAALQGISDGTAVTDAAACSAYRHLFQAALQLDPSALDTFALYWVTP